MAFNLLLENGDKLLLENGNGILLEDFSPPIVELEALNVGVSDIVVTTTFEIIPRRFVVPRRDLIWVHGYAGERRNVID